MGFIDTFERKEVKHVLDARQYEAIQRVLREHMDVDAYGQTTITSVYYDTPGWDLIARSLEKPLYKEKLRVRVYGDDMGVKTAPAFVEIKKKYKGIVYKRRVCMTQEAVGEYFCGAPYELAQANHPLEDELAREGALSAKSLQIAGEIDRFREFHGPLSASMIIRVKRTAWAPKPDAGEDFATENLRITFDNDLQYCNLRERRPAYRQLRGEGTTIMEVKAMGAMPSWLTDALSELKIFPSSFSKYGEAYKTIQMGEHKPAHAAHAATARKDIAC